MLFLGCALHTRWPPLRRTLLIKALEAFKGAESSENLYENSAGVFGQARTLAAIARLEESNDKRNIACSRLNDATNLFRILDDVTGLENVEKLEHSIKVGDTDPWIS